MSCDSTSIYIDPLAVLGGIIDITTLSGTGTGETLVNDGVGNDLVTKDLIAGGGITLVSTPTDITIVNAAATPTLQDAYDNGVGPPQITLTAADGPVTIDDNAVPTGGNFFQVRDSGAATTVFSVDATSVTVDGKLNVTGLIDPTGMVFNQQVAAPVAPGAGEVLLFAIEPAVVGDPARLVQIDGTTGYSLDITETLRTSISSTSPILSLRGPWDSTGVTTQNFVFNWFRVGGIAFVRIEAQTYAQDAGGDVIFETDTPQIPTDLRPAAVIDVNIMVFNSDFIRAGMMRLFSSGHMQFYILDPTASNAPVAFVNGAPQAGTFAGFTNDVFASYAIDV